MIETIAPNDGDGSRTAPWVSREADGLYVASNKSVWLYRALPMSPLKWEDPGTQLQVQAHLNTLLVELGSTSKDLGGGLRIASRNREFHLALLTWDSASEPPEGSSPKLLDFLDDALPALSGRRALLIGVRLRSSAVSAIKAKNDPLKQALGVVQTVLGGDPDNLDAFLEDARLIDSILRRNSAYPAPAEVLDQLESWFNAGRGPDAAIEVETSALRVNDDVYEISAVMDFGESMMTAPWFPWISAATTSVEPALVVSIRGALEPATVTRGRLRMAQRRVMNQIEEQAQTGDLERAEDADAFQAAKALEDYTQQTGQAFVTDCSILFARRVIDESAADTFIDTLRNSFNIDVKPLEHRQLEALAEMLPCGSARANPFLHDLTPSTLAYSGIVGSSDLGDPAGLWVGVVDPHDVPLWLDPKGAPAANLPPAMAICGDPGSGKAQPLDARVLTPSGWRTMGDLKVGDQVVGMNGRPRNVTGVFPQGVKEIYRVTFSDGTSTECCAEHLWVVGRSPDASRGKGWEVKSTQELLAAGLKDRDGKRRFRIPVTEPVAYPAADLPLDPYLVGLLLGDGGLTGHIGFSAENPELLTAIDSAIPAGYRVSAHNGCDDAIVNRKGQRNEVLGKLQALGITGHRAHERFIPASYQRGSAEQRWALLQGLLDTDGELTKANSVKFGTSSPRLAEDVTELAQSLGCVVRRTTKKLTYTHDGETRQERLSYVLTIAVSGERAPFRLARKAAAWKPRTQYLPPRSIESIEPAGKREAQCIMVDAEDRTYLTDDYIVTHNTFLSQLIAVQAALNGENVVLINPKGFDTLAPFAHYVASRGVPSRVVSMSQLEAEGGFFDPFTFCEPEMAAEVAAAHIQTVLANGLSATQEVKLQAGLKRGAVAGARCVVDALQHVEDKDVIQQVLDQAEGSTMFALGIAHRPRPDAAAERGVTLIEFDRDLDLPESSASPSEYTRQQRIALAAIRLVVRASMEKLMQTRGGLLIVDEAWTFLSSKEGLAALQRMGRLGRSLNLLPIFATQRIADILANDLEGYLSRVFAMKLSDDKEAAAALKLVGLEPTRDRLDLLKEAGSVKPKDGMPGRGSLALHRDLRNRHALVEIAAGIPAELREAISTNPEERRAREENLAREQGLLTPSATREDGFANPFAA